MKKYILIIYFVFLFSFVNAVTLSMSPPQIDLSGGSGEELCSSIHLVVDFPENLTGKTLWAEEGVNERNLLKHKLSPEELKIEVKIPKEVYVESSKNLDICVVAKRSGNYHGLLLYKVEGKPVQVGIWLNLSIGGKNTLKISGEAVADSKSNFKGLLGISLILVIILIGLFLISRRKRE